MVMCGGYFNASGLWYLFCRVEVILCQSFKELVSVDIFVEISCQCFDFAAFTTCGDKYIQNLVLVCITSGRTGVARLINLKTKFAGLIFFDLGVWSILNADGDGRLGGQLGW